MAAPTNTPSTSITCDWIIGQVFPETAAKRGLPVRHAAVTLAAQRHRRARSSRTAAGRRRRVVRDGTAMRFSHSSRVPASRLPAGERRTNRSGSSKVYYSTSAQYQRHRKIILLSSSEIARMVFPNLAATMSASRPVRPRRMTALPHRRSHPAACEGSTAGLATRGVAAVGLRVASGLALTVPTRMVARRLRAASARPSLWFAWRRLDVWCKCV